MIFRRLGTAESTRIFRLFHGAVCDLRYVTKRAMKGKLDPDLYPRFHISAFAPDCRTSTALSFRELFIMTESVLSAAKTVDYLSVSQPIPRAEPRGTMALKLVARKIWKIR